MNLHAYVGRQAIFNRALHVVGYELLYRDSFENRARFANVDAASATTIINACLELGLDELAGVYPIWVNLPQAFLLGDLPVLLPPERTVLEVLENVVATPRLIDSLANLRRNGYHIAIDNYVPSPHRDALLDVADIVKLDVHATPRSELERRFHELRPRCKLLLAEKVSTPEDHAHLAQLGFDLFQGYFFEKPVVARSERMPHNRAALLALLGRLYDPHVNYRELEQLLSGDVGLTVKLFKLAGSAEASRGQPLASVAQAVSRLGTAQVASLVLLLVVAGFDDKPTELMRQALIRAKLCEGLARLHNLPADQLFTAGLLSLLDAVFDCSIETVLRELPVTDLIRDLLLERGDDRTRKIFALACAQSRGDLAAVARSDIPAHTAFMLWYDAIHWAEDLVRRVCTG